MGDIELTSAVNELKEHQRQLDPDGWEVGVSRQALDIVLEALARSGLEARKAEESMRERAVKAAEAYAAQFPAYPEFDQMHNAAIEVANTIRALPLTGGDKP